MPDAWRSQLEDLLDAELRDGPVDDPFRPAVLRWATATGRPADHGAVLTALERVRPGGRGADRFRWRTPVGRWIAPERLERWRPAEAELAQRHPNDHAARLWVPPILAEHLAWLEELAAGTDPAIAARARAIADEALPVIEDVVAQRVAGTDAWADTFLLWSLTRSPRALAPVRGLTVALAARYAARAQRDGGIVRGRSFPYFETAMPSATAHLAMASAMLGEGVQLLDQQLAYLLATRAGAGCWGDPRQDADVLTTLAAARLFGTIDPDFDPASVVAPLRAMAGASGARPCLIGPEWPWLACELVTYLEWAALPFGERFRFPNVPASGMDPKVAVPRFEGYLMLAELFARVPALRAQEVDVVFIDLANFGAWNKDYGQDAGDDLLRLLARHLKKLPHSRTYRDGGDEFLIVGAPGTDGLERNLQELCLRWPAISEEAFPGVRVVPLRVILSREPAHKLRAVRQRQGRHLGVVKAANTLPPDEGVMVRLGS